MDFVGVLLCVGILKYEPGWVIRFATCRTEISQSNRCDELVRGGARCLPTLNSVFRDTESHVADEQQLWVLVK